MITELVTSVGDPQLMAGGPEKSAPLPESEETGDFLLGTESGKQELLLPLCFP